MRLVWLPLSLMLVLGTACSSLSSRDPADEPPPLVDMEEPAANQQEPQDESMRLELDPGSFTGIVTDDAKRSLDTFGQAAVGVPVVKVVENSPAAIAGIEEGDLLVVAKRESGQPIELSWSSEWRRLELEAAPGENLDITIDRAGAEKRTRLTTVRRVKPARRGGVERFREEERLGFVVRTATEVEARAAGLGPGGGAVVVGLSARSPLREFGLRFGDLLTKVDDRDVAHPQVVIDAVRNAGGSDTLHLEWRRGAEALAADVPLARREGEFTDFNIPVLVDYEKSGEDEEFSFLLGLFGYETTAAAWKVRLLWFLTFGGGDSDRLEEVKP